MKSMAIVLLAACLAGAAWAADEPVPAGMEIKELGGAKFLVPKGTRVSKKGDLIVLEPIEQYVARTIAQMQESLAALERGMVEMNAKIDMLLQAPEEEATPEEPDEALTSE